MATVDYTNPLQNKAPGAADQGRSIADDAKETARSMLGEQQKAAATGIGDFAGALRKAARDMGDARQAPMSRMLEGAADGLERFSGTLREKDLNGLMREVEGFARRQPVAFFGAAVAAGFLAVRFLKSSKQRDDNSLPY
jgi:hypothetical protein